MSQVTEAPTEETEVDPETSSGLKRGTCYLFNPTIKTTGHPTAGTNVHEPAECEFSEGWYLGFYRGKHKFQGKPLNDVRNIYVPTTFRAHPVWAETMRNCFFSVESIEGTTEKLDPSQMA